jgi:hypothetical protein
MELTQLCREREPDGLAEGVTSSATQQSKHFQRGSATVLCATVNSKAQVSLRKIAQAAILNAPRRTFMLWQIDTPALG